MRLPFSIPDFTVLDPGLTALRPCLSPLGPIVRERRSRTHLLPLGCVFIAMVSQVDPEWAEIAQRLVPLPASGGVFTVCDVGSTGGKLAPPCNGTASGEHNALAFCRRITEASKRPDAKRLSGPQGGLRGPEKR